ncbi:helix-turn-helix domain-containing protein [Bacillus velezensis]|uniref:helix-turn-helix domain-containing protein n=1 Tax=Bacillus velezensis TaxID=492670 RepID=UPI0018E703C8
MRETAEKVGLDHSYLSKIERGVQNPSLKTIESLSNFLMLIVLIFHRRQKFRTVFRC